VARDDVDVPKQSGGDVVTSAAETLEARVWEALARVADPEIPCVSVVEMGMVAGVEIREARARVVMLPTFTGCPAIDVIKSDVARSVSGVEDIDAVDVDTTFDPAWTTDRITPEGREKLRAFGLAPPTGNAPVLITEIGLPKVAQCPFCGSRDTVAESFFGPTPCRAVYYCNGCRNPFEQFKPV
jgi:ring-1,2-phenylacetyl-CoA epoxidase subunit PaaD